MTFLCIPFFLDIMGCVKWCGDMDTYGSEAKDTKKINFDLQDLE